MSSAYYQGYGTQQPGNYANNNNTEHLNYHQEPVENLGYVSNEYMRQPPSVPYPTAPVAMPQPMTQYLHHHTVPPPQPSPHQEPQVIIVHQNNEPDCCCECFRCCCDCLGGIVSGVCQAIIVTIFILIVLLLIAFYFIKFHNKH